MATTGKFRARNTEAAKVEVTCSRNKGVWREMESRMSLKSEVVVSIRGSVRNLQASSLHLHSRSSFFNSTI